MENKRQAIIISATALGGLATLIGTNLIAWHVGNSNGYKIGNLEGRKGYTKLPKASGIIEVSYEGDSPNPKVTFTPRAKRPYFRPDEKWNSENNRDYIEYSIKNEMMQTLFNGTNKPVNVTSAACTPQTQTNFWDCSYRELGQSENTQMKVEIDPQTGTWQSG